jgi:hypothetical protein
MAKKLRVLKRSILAEIRAGAVWYTLSSEHHPHFKMSLVLRRRLRKAISDRRNTIVWKKRVTRRFNYDHAKWAGHELIFKLGIKLIDETRIGFAARGGWQDLWTETKAGNGYGGDSIATWRQRAKELLIQAIGDWEPQPTNDELTQPPTLE